MNKKILEEVFVYLLKNNKKVAKDLVLELENKKLEFPIEMSLKTKNFSEAISKGIEFFCALGSPLGLITMNEKKKENEKKLKDKKERLKDELDKIIRNEKNDNLKEIYSIFYSKL